MRAAKDFRCIDAGGRQFLAFFAQAQEQGVARFAGKEDVDDQV